MAAMPRSLALPLLLVLSISSEFTAHAARSTTLIEGDSVDKACYATTFSKICVDTLKPNPASRTASPRELALMAFQHVAKQGPALIPESEREVAECKDEAIKGCLSTLDGNLKDYAESLSILTPEHSDVKFGEAKFMLTSMLSVPSNSGANCSEAAINAKPIIRKIFLYEEMLQVTLDLMEDARHSALPPPEAEKKEVSGEGKKKTEGTEPHSAVAEPPMF